MDEKLKPPSENDEDGHAIFDEILQEIGSNGFFQKRFNIIFNFLLVIFVSMPYLNLIMALSVPEHWCHVPGRENTSMTSEEWINFTIPTTMNTRGVESYSKCQMYNISTLSDTSKNINSNSTQIIDCQFGWEYDKTWYTSTAPSEYDWVCEKELYVTNTFVFGRIGDVIGTFIFGQLGDAYGRRPIFFITIVVSTVGRIISAFTAQNYSLFAAAALFGSLSSTAVFMAPLVVAMEVSQADMRAHIAMMQSLGWVTGMCLMPMLMWGLGNWVPFMLVTTLPSIAFLFTGRYLIESPRWLLARGQTGKCIKQLQHIARVNEKKLPEDAILRLKSLSNQKENVYGVMSLFSSWRLAKNTLLLLLCWSVISLTYYTLIFNVTNMAGNPFLNFLLQSLVELPGYIIGKYLSDMFGRRLTQFGAFVTTFVALIPTIISINDPSLEWLTTYLTVFIRFCISFVFYVVNLQSLETYPTCARQTGTALCSIVSNAVGVLAPYIVYLGTTIDARVPFAILAVLVLISGILGTFLPETLNQKLAETLAEAHSFGHDQKFWSFPKKKGYEKPPEKG